MFCKYITCHIIVTNCKLEQVSTWVRNVHSPPRLRPGPGLTCPARQCTASPRLTAALVTRSRLASESLMLASLGPFGDPAIARLPSQLHRPPAARR